MIPSRGAWLEFEVDKRDIVGVRIDRKRKQGVTVLLKALGWDDAKILERFGDYESMRTTLEKDHLAGQDEALLDIYRKLRPGEPPTRESCADPARQPLLQPQALRPGQGRPLQAEQEARPEPADQCRHAHRRRHRRDHRVLVKLHQAGGVSFVENDVRVRGRRHRPLRQPPPAHRRRADPEPGPHGPGPHGARRPRADDDPGRRGDHAADPDQHPSGRRQHQGVLRNLPAVAVHGPDEPAGRPDPQASPLGARPRWSVA